jgi:hypothetical protein
VRQVDPEEFLSVIDLVHLQHHEVLVQLRLQRWRIFTEDHGMDVEFEWHARIS